MLLFEPLKLSTSILVQYAHKKHILLNLMPYEWTNKLSSDVRISNILEQNLLFKLYSWFVPNIVDFFEFIYHI